MINDRYAKSYCSEDISNIENYELAKADDSQCWDLHHRLEIREDYINTREELKMMNIYYDRPASELIFLPHSEHISMHCKLRTGSRNPLFGRTGESHPLHGKKLTDSHKKALSESHRGEKSSRYGVFGDKNPCWKGDSVSPLCIYNRGYRMYKRGEISDEEFQKYRDIRNEYYASIGGRKRTRISKGKK